MKKYIFWISFLVILTFFSGQGLSQPLRDFEKPPSKKQLEKIRKRVETFKMWELTKSLDLDEETASKLFPLMNRYDKKRLRVQHRMRKDIKALRNSIDTADEDKLQGIIKSLKGHHRELQKINDDEMRELREILDVRELAKYIIFKHDFDREMRKIIAKARRKHKKEFKKE